MKPVKFHLVKEVTMKRSTMNYAIQNQKKRSH